MSEDKSNEKLSKSLKLEFEELFERRAVWNDHWQIVGEVVHGSKQEFTEQKAEGERLNEDRYGNAGVFASRTLASSLIGMLWPNGAKSIKLFPARGVADTEENKKYYEAITEEIIEAMDDPQARLAVSLAEYMLDQVSFGTSGIGIFDGEEESSLRYEAWGISQLYIAEGNGGRIETMYRLSKWTLRRIIATYTLEGISEKLRNLAKNDKNLTQKFEILQCIKKRTDRNVQKKGNKDMPVMSVHLERESGHILKESGFEEMPVNVARFVKLAYEEYGRSPGMDALSDVLEIDYLRERFSVNVEKAGDPPLIVMDDGRFGGGTIDTSAGAINVIDLSGRISNNIDPIVPLQTVGELNSTLTRIDQLKADIGQFFFLDKLLDFNNQTQMTASEALLRDRIRSASLGSIFARQIAETFDPLVTRSFNVLLKKGKMGVVKGSDEEQLLLAAGEEPIIIPDEIAKRMQQGKNVYEIRYFTPAAQIARLQEAEALNNLTTFKLTLQQGNPDAGDGFDDDEALKLAADVAGISSVLRSDEAVKDIRKQRAQAQEQQQQAALIKEGASAAKDANQAGLI